jgi:hypothetical protein
MESVVDEKKVKLVVDEKKYQLETLIEGVVGKKRC